MPNKYLLLVFERKKFLNTNKTRLEKQEEVSAAVFEFRHRKGEIRWKGT